MRKIVDSNYLQNPKLRAYLAERPTNMAVLTDYAAMEAYKGDTLQSIFKSMAILSEFPAQVIVLKGTRLVAALSGRSSGLTKRMIDNDSTKEFPLYCKNLKLAEQGHPEGQRQLLEHGKAATQHLKNMEGDAATMIDAFDEVASNFTPEEIRSFRTDSRPSRETVRKFLDFVIMLTLRMVASHPSGIRKPPANEVSNTFLFRFCLCQCLAILNWIRNGGQKIIKTSKVLNDMVDVNFATYSLYFDGLLTNDQKLMNLHEEAELVLAMLTGQQSRYDGV